MATKRKTWVGRVHLGGGRYHWVGRFPTRAERNEAVARAKVERPWDATASADEWTVDQWAARFLARMESGDLRTRGDRRYKDSSIDTARGQLKALRAEFGGRGLNSITRVEAEDWAARVRPSAIPIAIQLMGAAYRAELIDRNRFEGLARPTEGRKNERPPSEGDMLLLLDGCSALGDDYAPVMRAMLTFAAFTLARPGELFALQWSESTSTPGSAAG